MRVLFGHRRGLPHTECGERASGHDLAPSGVVAPLGFIRTVVFERAVLHEFAVEPAIARIADVFEEHAPQVRADLAYTSFVQCGYQFVCHCQTTPQISPACRRYEHLLHIKYVTVHILNYLPHSATPCQLQRVALFQHFPERILITTACFFTRTVTYFTVFIVTDNAIAKHT